MIINPSAPLPTMEMKPNFIENFLDGRAGLRRSIENSLQMAATKSTMSTRPKK